MVSFVFHFALLLVLGLLIHVSLPERNGGGLIAYPGSREPLDLAIEGRIPETVVVEPEVLSITFDSVIQDSRCPSTVECFWEGVAIIQLQLVTASPTVTTIVLASHDNIPMEVGTVVDTLGYRFELLSVDPYPVTTDPIPLREYVATLLISTTQPVVKWHHSREIQLGVTRFKQATQRLHLIAQLLEDAGTRGINAVVEERRLWIRLTIPVTE